MNIGEKRNVRKELYHKVLAMNANKRAELLSRSTEGLHWLSALTPIQVAQLFPDYYKKSLPSPGLTLAASGGVTMAGASPFGTPSAGPLPSRGGGSQSRSPWNRRGGGDGGGSSSATPTKETLSPDEQLWRKLEEETGEKRTQLIPEEGKVPVDAEGNVDRTAFYNQAVRTFSESPMNGFIPKDGEKYGIDGSPQSWANFAMRTAKVESGFNVNETNKADEGGSFGLFQWGHHYGINEDNWRDPQAQLDAFKEYAKTWVIDGGGYILPPPGTDAKRYAGFGGFGAAFSTARNDKINSQDAWNEANKISEESKKKSLAEAAEKAKEVPELTPDDGKTDVPRDSDQPKTEVTPKLEEVPKTEETPKPEGLEPRLSDLWDKASPEDRKTLSKQITKMGGVEGANEWIKKNFSNNENIPNVNIGERQPSLFSSEKEVHPWNTPKSGNTPNSREFGGPRPSGVHAGQDTDAEIGTSIKAHMKGKVVAMRRGGGLAGNMIDIEFEDGTIHRHMHLGTDNNHRIKNAPAYAEGLKVGDTLESGEVFAYSGVSGTSGSYEHTHNEIFPNRKAYNKSGGGRTISNRIDPRQYWSENRDAAIAEAERKQEASDAAKKASEVPELTPDDGKTDVPRDSDPVPMKDRGITTHSGHTAPSSSQPLASEVPSKSVSPAEGAPSSDQSSVEEAPSSSQSPPAGVASPLPQQPEQGRAIELIQEQNPTPVPAPAPTPTPVPKPPEATAAPTPSPVPKPESTPETPASAAPKNDKQSSAPAQSRPEPQKTAAVDPIANDHGSNPNVDKSQSSFRTAMNRATNISNPKQTSAVA